jgi:hypothetical protein
MLMLAVKEACWIVSPTEPPDDAWEKEADAYCLRFARTQEPEMPSPEVASALVPRLQMAGTFAPIFEQLYASSSSQDLLEALLITCWRDTWKAQWLAGQVKSAPKE